MNRKPLFYLFLFLSMLFLGWWIGTKTVEAEQKRIKPLPESSAQEGQTLKRFTSMKQNPQTLCASSNRNSVDWLIWISCFPEQSGL